MEMNENKLKLRKIKENQWKCIKMKVSSLLPRQVHETISNEANDDVINFYFQYRINLLLVISYIALGPVYYHKT